MTERRYHLTKSHQGDWVLKAEGEFRATRRFATKAAAIAPGVIEKALNRRGGSLKIHKEDGAFQEERSFPGTHDAQKPSD